MNFDQLVTFRTVSNVKSFRRAGEALHLTQPAVSKQVHALELELGERLFERGRTVHLTSAGKMLLKHADRISQILQIAREEIADLKELRRGHLSIGASHMITIHVLPQLLKTYRGRYPQVSLSVDAGWATDIVGQVIARDLDLALVSLLAPRPDDPSPLISVPLASTEMIFVNSPTKPLVKRHQVTIDELGSVPWTLNHKGCLCRAFLEKRFAERGLAMNVAVEVAGFDAQKKLVELGLGVALLPKRLVAKELKEGTLKTFRVKGINIRMFSCLVYRKDRYIHGAMRGFLELLREAFVPAKVSFSSHHP